MQMSILLNKREQYHILMYTYFLAFFAWANSCPLQRHMNE